jgi:hypothetical protein
MLKRYLAGFQVGLPTNFFVVQAQWDLATAQNAELRALSTTRRTLVDFERVPRAGHACRQPRHPAAGGAAGN